MKTKPEGSVGGSYSCSTCARIHYILYQCIHNTAYIHYICVYVGGSSSCVCVCVYVCVHYILRILWDTHTHTHNTHTHTHIAASPPRRRPGAKYPDGVSWIGQHPPEAVPCPRCCCRRKCTAFLSVRCAPFTYYSMCVCVCMYTYLYIYPTYVLFNACIYVCIYIYIYIYNI